jgi:hypothetical protein
MPFKGGTRQFSNRYFFTGGTPADGSHWNTLFNNVSGDEKTCHSSAVVIVEGIGYAAGSDVPVFQTTSSIAGTVTPTSGAYVAPGECAALVRYATAAHTTKNHPVYGFNYYHHIFTVAGSSNCDELDVVQKSTFEDYAAQWIAGYSDGTLTLHRATQGGHTATGSLVEEFVTHRDFPYSTSV